MNKEARPESLTRRTLWKVATRITIVVIIATLVSYWHVKNSLERQALEQLEQYVEERRARESDIFVLARENLKMFAEGYISNYKDRTGEIGATDLRFRFQQLFRRLPDGTSRLRDSVFRQTGISGFIGKHVTITNDLQRRLIVAVDMLSRYGPAWRSRFPNLYVVTPENAVIMYWPDEPWAQTASEWEVFGKIALAAGPGDDVVVLNKRVPLQAGGRWSPLYFDYGINDWLVSAYKPVILDTRSLLSVGQDLLLHDLIERMLTADLKDTYNIIFHADGRLIAHPRYTEAIHATSGALSVDDTDDDNLRRIFRLSHTYGDRGVIIENTQDSEFLAVTRLDGPGWYVVTVFPKSIVSAQAFETARLVLFLGLVALVAEIGILYFVLKRQVSLPLNGLIEATRQVASGRFARPLKFDRRDEIGQLARSFDAMAREVDARETALSERSTALSEVNVRLEHELQERARAEAEVARQREALHQSEKLNALGSMLAGVAHELNNPLSVVIGRSHLLQEQLRETAYAAPIGKIRTAADRCAKIVKTFLAMARQQPPARQIVHVGDILEAALDVISYNLTRYDIDVVVDISDNLPCIEADPNQLSQVISNLIINAQQALAAQEGRRLIRVNAAEDKKARSIRISVCDNGPGIPEHLRSRVFEPFFTTKSSGEGTGIGLSVSLGIVQAHGGAIVLDEPPQGGTRFSIVLPTHAANHTALQKA